MRPYILIRNTLLAAVAVVACYDAYIFGPDWYKEYKYNKIKSIYAELVAQSGQIQDRLPLEIKESPIQNAYNDGTKVVIYTGIVDIANSWDAVALILGHEIAHGMLGHLDGLEKRSEGSIAVLEGNADKMGAVYLMKAGYDICKAREFWKEREKSSGNYMSQDHPDYAYRYAELNINCS